MIAFTKRIPTSIAGVVLGLAALGNLLQSYGDGIRLGIGAIAAVVYIALALKIILHAPVVAEEMKNPVIASVFATFPMATMLLATYLKPYSPQIGKIMWLIGVGLHIALILYFTATFVLKLKWPQVFPSWFIVYCGIAVASVTCGAYEMFTIGKIAFWFAFISLLVLLPIVTKRYSMKIEEKPLTKPLLAVYTAPAALCLAGFVNAKPVESIALLWFMIILSQFLYLFVLTQMPRLLKMPFMPSYASFTFPFVISALSLKLSNGLLAKTNPVPLLGQIVKIEEGIATVLVFYTLFRFLQFIFVTSKKTA